MPLETAPAAILTSLLFGIYMLTFDGILHINVKDIYTADLDV